ncbi:uncharacterized protein LOC130669961 [Microplitis mediator]|uniref:uncharacterized protein LOC130669961 n=1 Tax=Microplitis mediator TaxID=375433 RepID=UPI0025548832|nr:uncharacterized protein LOC130669961 [Microplitis mediator]
MWNCYQAVIDNELRSNNSVEGWHHSFNCKVRVAHEIFSTFVRVIIDEQEITETNVSQIDAGADVVAKRRKIYIAKEERIKVIVERYDVNNKMKYLKSIASVIQMK